MNIMPIFQGLACRPAASAARRGLKNIRQVMCFFILCSCCTSLVAIIVAIIVFVVVVLNSPPPLVLIILVCLGGFLVLSVVCTFVINTKIVGLELPHPLPLHVAVLGGRHVRQRSCAVPLDIRVVVRIIVLIFVPRPSHHLCLLLLSSLSSCW